MFNRFGEIAFEPVPLAEYGIAPKWKGLAAAQDDAARLIREFKRVEREVQTLEAGRADAREQDLAADARALQAGDDLPEPEAEPALETKIAAAVRTRAAYERAASEAVGKAHALRAEHARALAADIQAALGKKAQELARHARQAASLYAEVMDGQSTAARLVPPPPAPSMENEPARDMQVVVGAPAAARMQGPNRGDVEAALAYLAGLGASVRSDTDEQQGAA